MNEDILVAALGLNEAEPFWLLNHFTVPLFMGALPFGTYVFGPRHNAAG
jgi:hypothetical protein